MREGPLMVIVPDRLGDLVTKGEVTPRYYNPGNIFRDVHLVATNDDRPPVGALGATVGEARLHVHNLPAPSLRRSAGWRPSLLRGWAREGVRLAREISPALIRCHGAQLNAFMASEIKRELGVPYAVSMHINPEVDVRGRARGLRARLVAEAMRSVEARGLRNADLVLPVYRPIVPFLEALGIDRYEVAYNVLNADHLREKQSYDLHSPARVISVGRQFDAKNPRSLIDAVAALEDVTLTLVGAGPAHEALRDHAASLGVQDRVEFLPAVSNARLCEMLPAHDVFATHSDYWEISKAVLEALLTGLPVVINRRQGEPVPELGEEIAVLVEDTPAGYRNALRSLLGDAERREGLGRAAYRHAQREWAPAVTEARYVRIYERLLAGSAGM